jgi:hypothetical protein
MKLTSAILLGLLMTVSSFAQDFRDQKQVHYDKDEFGVEQYHSFLFTIDNGFGSMGNGQSLHAVEMSGGFAGNVNMSEKHNIDMVGSFELGFQTGAGIKKTAPVMRINYMFEKALEKNQMAIGAGVSSDVNAFRSKAHAAAIYAKKHFESIGVCAIGQVSPYSVINMEEASGVFWGDFGSKVSGFSFKIYGSKKFLNEAIKLYSDIEWLKPYKMTVYKNNDTSDSANIDFNNGNFWSIDIGVTLDCGKVTEIDAFENVNVSMGYVNETGRYNSGVLDRNTVKNVMPQQAKISVVKKF